MLRGGHFRTDGQSGQLPGLAHPDQSLEADPFERSGFGSRFPYSGTENIHHARCGNQLTRRQGLFLGLRTAWSGDDQRSFCFNIKRFHILSFIIYYLMILRMRLAFDII